MISNLASRNQLFVEFSQLCHIDFCHFSVIREESAEFIFDISKLGKNCCIVSVSFSQFYQFLLDPKLDQKIGIFRAQQELSKYLNPGTLIYNTNCLDRPPELKV